MKTDFEIPSREDVLKRLALTWTKPNYGVTPWFRFGQRMGNWGDGKTTPLMLANQHIDEMINHTDPDIQELGWYVHETIVHRLAQNEKI